MTDANTVPPTLREPRLLGQTVVVIGGSSGIGLETARRARAEGAEVVLTGRDPDRLRHAALELDALSSAAFDATDFECLDRFFGELPTPVDHVMVTAGGPYYARLPDIDFEQAHHNVEQTVRLEKAQHHLLQQARQRRPLRGVGTAATLRPRDSRGIQVSALNPVGGCRMSEGLNRDRRRFLAAAAMTVAAVPFGVAGCGVQRMTGATTQLPIEGELPSLGGANAWLNSQRLTASSLRGKVVLVQFCTYTCINWLRTLPYVRAWAEKYKGQGLVSVGVHTPEFAFEKDLQNVRRALKEMGVVYPVAVDNNYEVWRAFKNRYWPALYFVDARGRVRHHKFGEGEYEQSERVIQRLLAEAGAGGLGQELVSVEGSGIEAAADWGSLKSPENYVGYERTENFASPGGAVSDERRVYAAPGRLSLNRWALSGDWTVGKQAVVLNEAGGRIAYRFHARDLHLVMGPAARGASVRFRVTLDGQPAVAAHGSDVDEQGNGTVIEQRLYQLIRQQKPITDRRFEIEFLDSGVEAFAFTFG